MKALDIGRDLAPPAAIRVRNAGWLASLLSVALTQVAAAQVPVLGRYQDFAYPADAVQVQAEIAYDELLTGLRGEGHLDDEFDLSGRVHRIAAGIIEQAIAQKPSAGAWRWEVHTTGEPKQSASSMAGGKLLFGSTYIRQLSLTDGELATLTRLRGFEG